MNFLCDRCKQKYHVADEKVRGRAVTRFKCKKCDHVIELRLTSNGGLPANALPDDGSVSESPASIPPPAPPTAARSASGPGHLTRPPGHAAGASSAARPPASTGLPVAARPAPRTGLPTRPATGTMPARAATVTGSLPALGAATRAGASSSTLSSRGLTPGAPQRAAVTSTGKPAPRPGVARPATATGPAASAARSTSPAASPLRAGLAGKNAAEPVHRSTTASALLNAAETGWYAGVRDLPVGPLTRSELATRIEAGDITPDSLVWREGLDDWRPLRAVAELSDVLHAAAQKMSHGLLGTMGRREATSPSKVVPIVRATSAQDEQQQGEVFEDDEPTRMTALSELINTVEHRGLVPPASASVQPSGTSTGAGRASSIPGAPSRSASSVAPAAAEVGARRSTAPPAPRTAVPAASAAAVKPEVSVTAIPATAAMPGATTEIATPAPAHSRPGGLPMGVWILMAGVLVAGVAVGLLLRPGTVPAAAPTAPAEGHHVASTTVPVEPTGRQVGTELRLPPERPTAPSTVAPATSLPAAVAVAAPTAVESVRRPVTTALAAHAANPATTGGHAGPSAGQLAALNAQLGLQGGVAQSTGPSNMQLRNATQTGDPGGGLTGEARAGHVIATLRRANVVDSCWTAAQRRNPAHPAESIRLAIDVGPTGRATAVRVSGAQDPDLVNCIQNRTRAQPYGAGGTVSAEMAFNLILGQ